MEYKFGFEKLEVWQNARLLVSDIYRVTQAFPDSERFGLTNQLRRAPNSVCANLAEGTTRKSPKEQGHFTSIAYGSLIEVLSHLMIASDPLFINVDELNKFREKIQPLSLKINNLRTKQLSFTNKLKTVLPFSFAG
jgi:four helix bundle protein